MFYSRKFADPFFVRVDTVAHLYAICDIGKAGTGSERRHGCSELDTWPGSPEMIWVVMDCWVRMFFSSNRSFPLTKVPVLLFQFPAQYKACFSALSSSYSFGKSPTRASQSSFLWSLWTHTFIKFRRRFRIPLAKHSRAEILPKTLQPEKQSPSLFCTHL
jgi:hypothetical protein